MFSAIKYTSNVRYFGQANKIWGHTTQEIVGYNDHYQKSARIKNSRDRYIEHMLGDLD